MYIKTIVLATPSMDSPNSIFKNIMYLEDKDEGFLDLIGEVDEFGGKEFSSIIRNEIPQINEEGRILFELRPIEEIVSILQPSIESEGNLNG